MILGRTAAFSQLYFRGGRDILPKRRKQGRRVALLFVGVDTRTKKKNKKNAAFAQKWHRTHAQTYTASYCRVSFLIKRDPKTTRGTGALLSLPLPSPNLFQWVLPSCMCGKRRGWQSGIRSGAISVPGIVVLQMRGGATIQYFAFHRVGPF